MISCVVLAGSSVDLAIMIAEATAVFTVSSRPMRCVDNVISMHPRHSFQFRLLPSVALESGSFQIQLAFAGSGQGNVDILLDHGTQLADNVFRRIALDAESDDNRTAFLRVQPEMIHAAIVDRQIGLAADPVMNRQFMPISSVP